MSVSNVVRVLAAALVLCIALPTIAQTSEAKPYNVGRQFKCNACHVNKMGEIRRPDGPTLVTAESVVQEAYGPQDASSTERMCFSCHDGFVMDSRFVWSGNHMTHPVGVALQEGMEIPIAGKKPALPLNDENEVYCGTCHLGHPGKEAAANSPIFVRTSRADGSLCSNCHEDKTGVAGTRHARVKATGQPQDFESRGICGKCHAPHDNKGPMMWSKTPKAGKHTAVNSLCSNCHGKKPTPRGHPTSILAWSQSVRESLIGKESIEMPVFDEQARHTDRGAIGCATCHDPHRLRADGLDPDVPGHFLRLTDTEGFLCADCHKSSALFLYKFYHSEKSRR